MSLMDDPLGAFINDATQVGGGGVSDFVTLGVRI